MARQGVRIEMIIEVLREVEVLVVRAVRWPR